MIDINNKHNFEDLMGCCIETENEWLNKKRNGHICYGKGGGGGQQQQDVPPTLAPYITEVLDRASDLYGVGKQYVPYEGERIVDFTADELAAQDAIRDQVGRGILGDETLGAASTYYDPALDLLGLSGQLSEKAVSEITANELMERMNPYQQAVTDLAKREAAREAQIYDQKLQAQAAGTGGFGGSRQAILEAQAAADLGTRLSDIQTKGSAAAFQEAVRAAEAQRAREAAGAQAAGGLSQLYGGLGQQALGQAYREAGYLSGLGETQRDMQQKRADLAYQQFVEQRDFPDTQLQKFSSLIQGFPFQFTQPGAVPSQFQQNVGTAVALGGLGRGLGFFNQGGGVGNQMPNMSSMGMGAKGAGIQNKFRPPQLGMPLGAGVGPNAPGASLGANPITPNFPPRPPMRPTGNGFPMQRPINFGDNFSDSPPRPPLGADDSDYINYVMSLQEKQFADQLNKVKNLYGDSPGLGSSGLSAIASPQPPTEFKKQLLDRIKENYGTMGGFRPSPPNRPGMGAKGAGIRRPTTPSGVRRPKVVSTPVSPSMSESRVVGLALGGSPTTSSKELDELLARAFKFDREQKEKAIKSRQGFDVAALGMEYATRPLGQFDTSKISKLAESQEQLAALDDKEAANELAKKMAELKIKEAEKKLKTDNFIELPALSELKQIESGVLGGLTDPASMPDFQQGIADARLVAQAKTTAQLALAGISSDSEAAKPIFAKLYADELRNKFPKFVTPVITPSGSGAGGGGAAGAGGGGLTAQQQLMLQNYPMRQNRP